MNEIVISADRAGFLTAGRMLDRTSKPSHMGTVVIQFTGGRGLIETEAGSAEFPCDSKAGISLELSGANFRKLIAAHRFEKDLVGSIKVTLRIAEKEIATGKAGVKVRRIARWRTASRSG